MTQPHLPHSGSALRLPYTKPELQTIAVPSANVMKKNIFTVETTTYTPTPDAGPVS